MSPFEYIAIYTMVGILVTMAIDNASPKFYTAQPLWMIGLWPLLPLFVLHALWLYSRAIVEPPPAPENPWPDGYKGHWWSGWPGAYCLRCGSEDPMENAIAAGWYDPFEGKWDSDLHKAAIDLVQYCPADSPKAKSEVRELIEDIRGGEPKKCDFCHKITESDKLEPEESDEWVCHDCIRSWNKNVYSTSRPDDKDNRENN